MPFDVFIVIIGAVNAFVDENGNLVVKYAYTADGTLKSILFFSHNNWSI